MLMDSNMSHYISLTAEHQQQGSKEEALRSIVVEPQKNQKKKSSIAFNSLFPPTHLCWRFFFIF
jgi:hypothetical protein